MVGSLSEISDTISFSSFMVVANLARRGTREVRTFPASHSSRTARQGS